MLGYGLEKHPGIIKFEHSKSEIKAKYEKKIKILEGQMRQEVNELKEKHDKAVGKAVQNDLKRNAGTLNEEHTCGTCGVKLEPDQNDPEDIDFDKIFCCEAGKFCGSGYHCNSHKSPKTKCSKCICSYCERCVDNIDKCASCWESDILTCGDCLKTTCPVGNLHVIITIVLIITTNDVVVKKNQEMLRLRNLRESAIDVSMCYLLQSGIGIEIFT